MPLELVDDVTTRVIDQDASTYQPIYIWLGPANKIVCISTSLVVYTPGDSDLSVF